MELPSDFLARIRSVYPNGAQWLQELPTLIEHATHRWGLTDIQPVPNLSYNFVAFARLPGRNRGTARSKAGEAVLKIGPPNAELRSELAALRLFDGQGCCRLLEADESDYAFLLERLLPGQMLSELSDDEQATQIAAGVMLRLWREVPLEEGSGWQDFIRLSDWFAALDGLRPRFGGGTGPFPRRLVERVEAVLPGLFADTVPPVLLHGDFHHFNVLSSGEDWRVIDPKGVIGPRGYECGPLLINPWGDFAENPAAAGVTARRVAILSERLGLERQVILDWGICHALLSAWWDFGIASAGADYSIACGEIFLETRL